MGNKNSKKPFVIAKRQQSLYSRNAENKTIDYGREGKNKLPEFLDQDETPPESPRQQNKQESSRLDQASSQSTFKKRLQQNEIDVKKITRKNLRRQQNLQENWSNAWKLDKYKLRRIQQYEASEISNQSLIHLTSQNSDREDIQNIFDTEKGRIKQKTRSGSQSLLKLRGTPIKQMKLNETLSNTSFLNTNAYTRLQSITGTKLDFRGATNTVNANINAQQIAVMQRTKNGNRFHSAGKNREKYIMRGSQPIIKNIVIRQKKALPPPKGRQERAWKWVCSYGVIPEEVGQVHNIKTYDKHC